MGCLNIKATLLNLPVVVGFSLLSGIECNAWVLNSPLKVTAEKASPNLVVRGHIVCSVGNSSYLRVSTEVIWMTPDMLSAEFEIYSNVDWVINQPENGYYLYISKENLWIPNTGSLNESFDILSNDEWNID